MKKADSLLGIYIRAELVVDCFMNKIIFFGQNMIELNVVVWYTN